MVLAAGGCAMLAPPPAALPALASVPAAFEMSGRLSVRQADRSDIAKLRWTHRRDRDVWSIASPLGNEVARIESNADGAVLSTGGSAQAADSFDDLTEKILGVPLNPRMLAAWLHGDLRETPAQWHVTIDETQKAGDVELARRLSAVRGETAVRLVVDDYQPLKE